MTYRRTALSYLLDNLLADRLIHLDTYFTLLTDRRHSVKTDFTRTVKSLITEITEGTVSDLASH